MTVAAPLALVEPRTITPNVEAEAAYLGAVFVDNEIARTSGAGVKPEHFGEPIHERIYARMLALLERGEPAKPLSLKPYFEADAGMAELGGPVYLMRLAEMSHGLLAPHLAQQVIANANSRKFNEVLRRAVDASTDPDANILEIAETVSAAAMAADRSRAALPFLSLDEMANAPAPEWLVHNLIGEESLGFVFGAPGAFKSFVVADLGLRISYGLSWHGSKVRQAGVLYIAAEGAGGLGTRVTGWRVQHGLRETAAPFVVVPVAVQFLEPESRRELLRTIDRIRAALNFEIGLTIIDTVSRSIPGVDENATEHMSAFVSACDEVRAHTGGAVLGVHHAGKDKDRGMRGSTVLLGAADFVIRADRDGDMVTLTVEKQKEAEEAGPFRFEMATVDWWAGNPDEPGFRKTTRVPVKVEYDLASDATPEARARGLKGHNKTAYETLKVLFAASGQTPPEEIPGHILDRSEGRKVLAAGHAADMVGQAILSASGGDPDKKTDTIKRGARRAIDNLKSAEILGSWGDWLWLK